MPRPRSQERRHRRYDPLAALAYIDQYQRQHQWRSPSQREIQSALHVSAPSVVHNMLHRLEHEGVLTITSYGRGRTADLLLTEAGQAELWRWRQHPAAEDGTHDRSQPRT